MIISMSWFTSLINRLHIDLENEIWKRFPYLCSYCGTCPCSCKENKIESRLNVSAQGSERPETLEQFQNMFCKIYPPESRTLEHAGVHLAEELGEMSESFMTYSGRHKEEDFKNISAECADFFSCMMGVFNSLNVNYAKELSVLFSNNCHVCHKAPCECSFDFVTKFSS